MSLVKDLKQDQRRDAEQGRHACSEPKEQGHEHGEEHVYGHGEALQGKEGRALKRKPAEDTEVGTVVKKRRYSADDAATFLPREPPCEGSKRWETKCVTMPVRAMKRRASPSMVSECWPEPCHKKYRLTHHHDGSHHQRGSSLRGEAAEAHRLDGHRTPARKRSCPLSSDSTESFSKSKRLKETTVASHQGRSLREEACEGNQGDGHKTPAYMRSSLLPSDCFSSSKRSESCKQASFVRRQEREDLIKAEKEKMKAELREMGVRVYEKHEVKAMSDVQFDVLGKGAFGVCRKTVDPDTKEELVVKDFNTGDLELMLKETKNLFHLQMKGVQRLVGVCVDDVQIISRFAGKAALRYFLGGSVSLADGATVFLQVCQALRRMVQQGYNHNDLHEGNVCVLEGSSGPVATLIDLGLTHHLGARANEANDIPDLARMMDRLLHPDKECTQHPLVADLIAWIKAATESRPEAQQSLEVLEHVLQAILDYSPRQDLVLKTWF